MRLLVFKTTKKWGCDITENLRFHFGTSSLKTELYHCGASLKDLGKKCFAISKIEDMEYVEKMSKFS